MKQSFTIFNGVGAWNTEPEKMPAKKGIYFVYRCKTKLDENGKLILNSDGTPTKFLDKLLYIGESVDACRRMKDHNRDDDVRTRDIPKDEALYYTFAEYDGPDENRRRIESALIYRHRKILPDDVGNTKNTKTFDYDETSINITGDYTHCLITAFTQERVKTPEE